jgi:transcriptional regulator with XRE-family HTH domain
VKYTIDADPLERARILRAWTRRHLAHAAHVDPGTLSDMCNGRRRPNLLTIQAVCTALDVSLADVIVFHDDEQLPVDDVDAPCQ